MPSTEPRALDNVEQTEQWGTIHLVSFSGKASVIKTPWRQILAHSNTLPSHSWFQAMELSSSAWNLHTTHIPPTKQAHSPAGFHANTSNFSKFTQRYPSCSKNLEILLNEINSGMMFILVSKVLWNHSASMFDFLLRIILCFPTWD